MRLIIIGLVIIILVLVSGGVYLWFIGGKALALPVTQTASPQVEIPPTYLPPPTYELGDIPVSTNDDTIALTDYSRAVGAIMSAYGNKDAENELALVIKAIEKTDAQAATKLAQASARHTDTALRLKQLIVPPTAVQVHLNLINSIIGLAESSYIMAQINKEPMVALEASQVYPDRLKNFFTAINNLNFFLLASRVILPEQERSIISLGL